MYNAELYEQCNMVQRRDALACLEEYAPKMKWKKNDNRIIDIGCGDGSVTNILQKYFPTNYKLVGSDKSENMVKFANQRYCNEQTSFLVLDIGGGIPDSMKGNFDHVFSFYALHWLSDQKRAFENIFNLLDQDGECFMIFLANHPVFDVYRALSRNTKWCTWVHDVENYISPYHDSEAPEKEITKLMEDVGFVDIDVQCKEKCFFFPDNGFLKKHMTAINPFNIPKDKNDDFMDDYVKILKGFENIHKINTNNCMNGISLRYTLLIVYGRKPSSEKASIKI